MNEGGLVELVLLSKLLSSGWVDSTGGFVPLQLDERRSIWEKLAATRKTGVKPLGTGP
ncbi:MAG: hypothetical protein K2R98_24815 [Gemmataceae bacterium]|nr:hypothetical protein [Gemmataceae bacterium]